MTNSIPFSPKSSKVNPVLMIFFRSTLYQDVEKYCEGKVKDDDMKFSSVIFPDISRFRTFMIMIFSEWF